MKIYTLPEQRHNKPSLLHHHLQKQGFQTENCILQCQLCQHVISDRLILHLAAQPPPDLSLKAEILFLVTFKNKWVIGSHNYIMQRVSEINV